MLFSISRSMHVSGSYELNVTGLQPLFFYFYFIFFPLFFSFINEMFRYHVFELILSVFVQEK